MKTLRPLQIDLELISVWALSFIFLLEEVFVMRCQALKNGVLTIDQNAGMR